jgi:hypothetical protein
MSKECQDSDPPLGGDLYAGGTYMLVNTVFPRRETRPEKNHTNNSPKCTKGTSHYVLPSFIIACLLYRALNSRSGPPFLSSRPRSKFDSIDYNTHETTPYDLGLGPYARSRPTNQVLQQEHREARMALSILSSTIYYNQGD